MHSKFYYLIENRLNSMPNLNNGFNFNGNPNPAGILNNFNQPQALNINSANFAKQHSLHKTGDAANSKRKTVPCSWFHGPKGCDYGDRCDFIHDPQFKGVMPHYHNQFNNLNDTNRGNSISLIFFSTKIQRNNIWSLIRLSF